MKRTKFPQKKRNFLKTTEDVKSNNGSDLSRKQREDELNKITLNIEQRLVNIKRDFFQIGKQLTIAKSLLPHGSFQPWIEKTFDRELPYSTAYAFMKIYENFYETPKTVQYMPVYFLMRMSHNTFPEEIKNLIDEHAEYIEKDDVKELNSLFMQYKKGQITLGKFNSQAEKYIKLGIEIEKGHTERRVTNNARKDLRKTSNEICGLVRKLRNTALNMRHLFPKLRDSEEEEEVIKNIDNTIAELKKLKNAIEGDKNGFFRYEISKNPLEGKKAISNL